MIGALVYVQGPRGPEPQKWPADSPALYAKRGVIAAHPLTVEQYTLPIGELVQIFQLPERKVDVENARPAS